MSLFSGRYIQGAHCCMIVPTRDTTYLRNLHRGILTDKTFHRLPNIEHSDGARKVERRLKCTGARKIVY